MKSPARAPDVAWSVHIRAGRPEASHSQVGPFPRVLSGCAVAAQMCALVACTPSSPSTVDILKAADIVSARDFLRGDEFCIVPLGVFPSGEALRLFPNLRIEAPGQHDSDHDWSILSIKRHSQTVEVSYVSSTDVVVDLDRTTCSTNITFKRVSKPGEKPGFRIEKSEG